MAHHDIMFMSNKVRGKLPDTDEVRRVISAIERGSSVPNQGPSSVISLPCPRKRSAPESAAVLCNTAPGTLPRETQSTSDQVKTGGKAQRLGYSTTARNPLYIGTPESTSVAYYDRTKSSYDTIVLHEPTNTRYRLHNLANYGAPASLPSAWVDRMWAHFSRYGDPQNSGRRLQVWARYHPQQGAVRRHIRLHGPARPLYCPRMVGNSMGDIFGVCDSCDHS